MIFEPALILELAVAGCALWLALAVFGFSLLRMAARRPSDRRRRPDRRFQTRSSPDRRRLRRSTVSRTGS